MDVVKKKRPPVFYFGMMVVLLALIAVAMVFLQKETSENDSLSPEAEETQSESDVKE